MTQEQPVGREAFPEDPAQEREIIKELDKACMVTGEMWFLISKKWFRCWKEFVQYDPGFVKQSVERPGEIDNMALMEDTGNGKLELKQRLFIGHDYDIVAPGVWTKLNAWYGGGPSIPRPVIETGYTKRKKIETYPLKVKVVHNANIEKSTSYEFTRALTMKDFKEKVCGDLKIDASKVRMYSYHVEIKGMEFKDETKTLEDERISDGSKVLFEEEGIETQAPSRSTTSTFGYSSSVGYPYSTGTGYGASASSGVGSSIGPSASSSVGSSYGGSSTGYGASSYSSYRADPVKPKAKGLTGLQNLGNTCFMNSALQCLSNTVALTNYFLAGVYKNEINADNPLGMKGQLANEFGELIKRMWSGNESSVAPRDFKWTLGKFAPQFSGFQQQDSQELLAFLLDGLHEDLNRVKNKPFVELKASDGRPDHIVAQEAWDNHLKRNQSVIVDLFQGQYKSTLQCPECNKISITFDPFMYLTLPLPETKTLVRRVVVWFANRDTPIKYGIKLHKNSKISDLKAKLEQIAGCQANDLVIAELISNRFHQMFSDNDPVTSTENDSLYAYEVPHDDDANKMFLKVLCFANKTMYSYQQYRVHALPFLLWTNTKGSRVGDLYRECWKKVSSLVQSEDSDDDSDDENELDEKALSELFELQIVDSFNAVRKLVNMDELVDFTTRSILQLQWNSKVFAERMNEAKMRLTIEDASVKSITEDTPKNRVTLNDCLDCFVQEEKLSPDDLWYCPSCKEHRQATKKMDLFMLPSILVVHLKRFQYTRYLRDKLSTVVDFPITNLDLRPLLPPDTNQETEYDLFAISNHYGMLGGGHYTAYAINNATGEWYSYDDSTVRAATESNLVSNAAYVLFYRRRSLADQSVHGVTRENTNNA